MSYPDKIHQQAAEIIARYPEGRSRSALLPLLHLVQSHDGYVSEDGIAFCAEALDITKAQVQAVSTFYTMYKREPAGDWLVSVCTNTLCHAKGGQKIFDELSGELGVGHDETTADGQITLEHAECLAACDYAPVVTVNYEFFDNMDEAAAVDLVRQLKEGKRPFPSRGAPCAPSARCRSNWPGSRRSARPRSKATPRARRPSPGTASPPRPGSPRRSSIRTRRWSKKRKRSESSYRAESETPPRRRTVQAHARGHQALAVPGRVEARRVRTARRLPGPP
ncbi:hypothetical protein GCM10029992_20700 [Glycomyces albus]